MHCFWNETSFSNTPGLSKVISAPSPCVPQVYPAKVHHTVNFCLDPAFSWDSMVATFATMEAGIGRRAPALLGLTWGDVLFVKQAIQLPIIQLVS